MSPLTVARPRFVLRFTDVQEIVCTNWPSFELLVYPKHGKPGSQQGRRLKTTALQLSQLSKDGSAQTNDSEQ